ncbi:MAG: DegT/DnrJ/EryC1/StrS family aminotransferase [Oscillospiraceae bacterium]|nr:DegT/DnrJ/EryC1/StrS family aminotransferase [Oscillospiraceae bacterium]
MNTNTPTDRARYGYNAFKNLTGTLPNPFPRIMGPNAGKYVQEVVDSGLTSNITARFESEFAQALGVKYVVSAPGCSNAILSLAEALNFNRGDEIIVSPITDYGTIMGIVKCGYVPVFADTEKDSCLISCQSITERITPKTKAILCVHKMGLMCDMDSITALGLPVIEDACQAVFSTYKDRKAGSIGYAGAFSFDSEKTMGSDIGGCFVTNDENLYNYALYFTQSRGAENKPGYGRLHVVPGSAMRMPSCTAAINLAQLEILPENVATRDKMIRCIYEMLATIDGITVEAPKDYQEVFSCWMAGFRVDLQKFNCTLEQFADACVQKGFTGLGTGYYYLLPEACTFLHGLFGYDYNISQYPNAVDYLSNFLRWSTFCEKYTEKDCELVYSIVSGVAEEFRK